MQENLSTFWSLWNKATPQPWWRAVILEEVPYQRTSRKYLINSQTLRGVWLFICPSKTHACNSENMTLDPSWTWLASPFNTFCIIILHQVPRQILLHEESWLCTPTQLLQRPGRSDQSVLEPNVEPPPVVCCGVKTWAQLLICCINRSAHGISQCARATGCEIIRSAPH